MRTGLPFVLSLFSVCLGACDNALTATPTGLVALSGGVFTMGSSSPCADPDGPTCAADRAPHPVRLSPFSIDKTEVTRLQFGACVVAGACRGEAAPPFDPDHKSEPVLVDDPQAARDYCTWLGRQLPTEAQFEFAARVDAKGAEHDYPWGDAAPTCDRVAYGGCATTGVRSVGTNPGDLSPAGVSDLAGNAPEWVDDSYDARLGCLDRFSWADLCGADASCVLAHCTDSTCLRGCLPPSEDAASMTGSDGLANAPECALATGDEPTMTTDIPLDPVLRAPPDFAVVRGAGPLDRGCDLAGWARRHATPGLLHAGFRCATQTSTRNVPLSYRFRLLACPTADYPVSISATDSQSGAPVTFSLEQVGASGPIATTVSSGSGTVNALPCGDAFVLRPDAPAKITVRAGDGIQCAAWSQTVDLSEGGDVPAAGFDALPLLGAPANQCSLPHAEGSCAGSCRLDACDGAWRDCDGVFADGCEVDTSSDPASCGACGRACANLPNATVACVASACAILACNPRFADCDGLAASGCETDLQTDPSHCGSCGAVCSPNHIALPACSSGACDGACDYGFADCNGNKLDDGCETSILTDVGSCGACGTACSTNHVTASCAGGSCGGRCDPDWADCNGDKRSDGCETDLDHDPMNCGACAHACEKGESCALGLCQP